MAKRLPDIERWEGKLPDRPEEDPHGEEEEQQESSSWFPSFSSLWSGTSEATGETPDRGLSAAEGRVRGRDGTGGQDTRNWENLLSSILGFDVRKSYGTKLASISSELIDSVKVRKGKKGNILGLNNTRNRAVTKYVDGKWVKAGDYDAWEIENKKLIDGAKKEFRTLSLEGDVTTRLESAIGPRQRPQRQPERFKLQRPEEAPRVQLFRERADEATRESIRRIAEEIKDEVSERAVEVSKGVTDYVRENMEGFYNAIRRDITEVGNSIGNIQLTLPQGMQPSVDVGLIQVRFDGLSGQIDELLSRTEGNVSDDIQQVTQRVTSLTSELRSALVGYDESLVSAVRATGDASGEQLQTFTNNVNQKLQNILNVVEDGNARVQTLSNMAAAQDTLTSEVSSKLTHVINTVNTLPRTFPSLNRLAQTIEDLKGVVIDRNSGTNLEATVCQINDALSNVTNGLADLENALTTSVSPIKDEIADLALSLERSVEKIRQVSAARDKTIGEELNKIGAELDRQSKASKIVEEKMQKMEAELERRPQGQAVPEGLDEVLKDMKKVLKERDTSADTRVIRGILNRMAGKMDRLEEKLQEVTGSGSGEITSIGDELRALRKALPPKKEGVVLSRQEVREINGVLSDTVTKDTPIDVVQARVKALDIQAGELEEEIKVEADEPRKNLLEKIKEVAETKADELRLRLGGEARYDATNETVDLTIRESNWTRLEKFKKWARENLIAISGVAIMAATLITSIVAALKTAGKIGAKGISAHLEKVFQLLVKS